MFSPSTFIHLAGFEPRAEPRRNRTAVDGAAVVIRPAAPADDDAIARLAALEDRPGLPGGQRLIGELGGHIVAALDIGSGRAVADPFVPTSAVVELLGLRAAQVRR